MYFHFWIPYIYIYVLFKLKTSTHCRLQKNSLGEKIDFLQKRTKFEVSTIFLK